MRLKYIAHADFRKSERTNFLELKKLKKLPALGKEDVVLLVSLSENQCVFVYGFVSYDTECVDGRERHVEICRSERLRITGSRWNPLMIRNYAERVGISIDGLKRFEDYYKEYAAA